MEEIRLLSTADVQEFKALRLKSLIEDSLSWLSTYDEEKNLPIVSFSNKIIYAQAAPIFGYWGFFRDGQLLAYVQISSSFWNKKRHVVTLYDVCVDKEFRRTEIGTKLINFVIKKTRDIGFIEQILLWVTSRNKGAIEFYKKIGFKEVAITPNTVKEKDGTYQDEHLFSFKI